VKPTTEPDGLERALLEAVGYAVTSARTLLDETATYGPLRLLETARRIIDAVRVTTGGSIRVDDLYAKIDAAATSLIEGEDAFRAHLDTLVVELVRLA